jgi:hypothetical protein
MDKANVVVSHSQVKSISQVRRRAKRHGLVMKRRGTNQFVLCRAGRIQPTYNGRRVESMRLEPVTDVLTLASVMDLTEALDHVTEQVSLHAMEVRFLDSMPTLFDQPLVAAESLVLQ